MYINETLSQKLHAQCVRLSVETNRISRNWKKDTSKTATENNQQIDNSIQNESVNNSLNINDVNPTENFSLAESSNTIDDSRHDRTLDLAKSFASLREDDIPPATNRNTITKTEVEYSNACIANSVSGRVERKFVSENVSNLSTRNITES